MMSTRAHWRATIAALGLATAALAAHAETERYWPPITDTPTGAWTPGRIVWAELLTADVGTAAQFYGRVFGWTFETYGPQDDFKTYTVVHSGDTPIGGMVYAKPERSEKFPSSRWVGFFSVADVGTTAALVEREGGRVVIGPRELGERGTEALLMDPEGGLFGVIHATGGDPGDYLAADDQWLWAELWATAAQKMSAFYRGVGPFEVVDGAVKGEASGYQLWSGGYARAGILERPAKVPTTWLPYVRVGSVTDTTAKAVAAGGRVVMQPTAFHGTQVAVILDPTGAPFAIAEWPPKASGEAR
ncbi:MAG: VOC family protein [Steroidobacteraceae bacterium]